MPKSTNPASKVRDLKKREKPYASWTDPRTGWKYKLLKSWQANNGKAYSRWLMAVDGIFTDFGDTYVEELWWGVKNAADLEFDTSVWPDRESFLRWAEGVME